MFLWLAQSGRHAEVLGSNPAPSELISREAAYINFVEYQQTRKKNEADSKQQITLAFMPQCAFKAFFGNKINHFKREICTYLYKVQNNRKRFQLSYVLNSKQKQVFVLSHHFIWMNLREAPFKESLVVKEILFAFFYWQSKEPNQGQLDGKQNFYLGAMPPT